MELELSEGRIHGARYYIVRPWPWDSHITWLTMEAWSIGTFGPDGGSIWNNLTSRWYMNNSKFWFRNEADRTFFILRWQ